MRAALARGEDGFVYTLLKVLRVLTVLAEEDETSTGATECLVPANTLSDNLEGKFVRILRGGGDDITVLEGVSELASSNKTAGVGDIGHQECAVLVSGSAESGVVPVTGVCRCTTNDETGLEQFCLRGESFVVDELGRRVKAIRERLEVD